MNRPTACKECNSTLIGYPVARMSITGAIYAIAGDDSLILTNKDGRLLTVADVCDGAKCLDCGWEADK